MRAGNLQESVSTCWGIPVSHHAEVPRWTTTEIVRMTSCQKPPKIIIIILKKDGSSCASYSSFLPESKDIIVKLIGEFKLGVGVNGSVSLY